MTRASRTGRRLPAFNVRGTLLRISCALWFVGCASARQAPSYGGLPEPRVTRAAYHYHDDIDRTLDLASVGGQGTQEIRATFDLWFSVTRTVRGDTTVISAAGDSSSFAFVRMPFAITPPKSPGAGGVVTGSMWPTGHALLARTAADSFLLAVLPAVLPELLPGHDTAAVAADTTVAQGPARRLVRTFSVASGQALAPDGFVYFGTAGEQFSGINGTLTYVVAPGGTVLTAQAHQAMQTATPFGGPGGQSIVFRGTGTDSMTVVRITPRAER